MAKTERQTVVEDQDIPGGRTAEIINTLEWLITAFILAFVFRAFVMEAFRIPTGSMADTLMGAHFRFSCRKCGYAYEHGYVPERYNLVRDTVPYGEIETQRTRCPSCGYIQWGGQKAKVSNGDRILVLKCIYQFSEPKRWDVVVFKNPTDPKINFIKRMVGRPGEMLEIIDGDIYIDDKIARKPDKVQEELWMPVYDNDYQPVLTEEAMFNGHTWRQPFTNEKGSAWINGPDNNTIFRLNSTAINTMFYDTSAGNDFRTAYAYNEVGEYESFPFCSDLMMRFYCQTAEREGEIGIVLGKYGINYRAMLSFDGEMKISRVINGREEELTSSQTLPVELKKPVLIKFANVDHQLVFQAGEKKLVWDLGVSPDSAGPRKPLIEPRAQITGRGNLTVSHAAVFRDIHYLSSRPFDGRKIRRASEGNAFKLKEDQFFVLGDNSPNSEDSRWWDRPGLGNNGKEYEAGIVPRDYLVGKAVFVYWPAGFPFEIGSFKFPLPVSFVPNAGKMRFIRGG